MMYVYLVFQNDALLGVYATGESAERRLNEVKDREPGTWERGKYRDADRYVQRWRQPSGRVARLSVEKEEVE